MNASLRLLLKSALLASCAGSALACGLADGGEDAASDQAQVSKTVTPTSGNGAFDLEAPEFDLTSFKGNFTFGGNGILPGARTEKAPGKYTLLADQTGYGMYGTPPEQQMDLSVTAGAIAKHKLGGLRVRFAEPINLGGVRVSLQSGGGREGVMPADLAWRQFTNGANFLVLAQTISVTSGADDVRVDVPIAEGELREVVLPTARVTFALDEYNADYPTPNECEGTRLVAGTAAFRVAGFIRQYLDNKPENFVVPFGPKAAVQLMAFGLVFPQPLSAGATHTITLNRLQVDDVAVTHSDGTTKKVKGKVRISRLDDGKRSAFNCAFGTRKGVDLPNGTYEVESTAETPAGPVKHVDTVTFP